MIYVPFKNRYRYKPDCLRAPKKKAADPTPAEASEATPPSRG